MSYDEHLISMAGGDGDGDMADVLAAHLYDLRTHSCACMEKRRNPPHLGFKKHAAHQAAMLTAAGFGLVREAQAVEHPVKRVRGELKSFGKHMDSWESEGHTTVTIRFMRQWIARIDAIVKARA